MKLFFIKRRFLAAAAAVAVVAAMAAVVNLPSAVMTSAATRQLLEDYKLIQYDVTAGDGYLKDLGFMDAPER